jgi:hypothetical protein
MVSVKRPIATVAVADAVATIDSIAVATIQLFTSASACSGFQGSHW